MRKPKNPIRRALEQFFLSRIAWLIARLSRTLSLSALRRIADAFAWLIVLTSRRRSRLAVTNISLAFPLMTPAEACAVRDGAVRNICRTMIELFKMAWLTPEQVAGLVRVEGLEHLRQAQTQGHGVMLLTAHYGNWEIMGARLAQEINPLCVIARDAPHSLTASLINQARERHRMKVLPRESLRDMLLTLRQGGALGILPDQHALIGGELIEFMDRPAWTFTGPATIALRTGAPIVPAFCVRQPDGTFVVEVKPPLELAHTGDREADVLENTQRINRAIEAAVRAHPDHWLWLHDRWKMKRVGEAVTEA